MCGIFAYLGCQCTSEQIKPDFDRIRYRGPDDSRWLNPNDFKGLTWGFHRLAISGLSHESDEPLRLPENWLICNGEIFNSRELAECFQFKTITQNDCERILGGTGGVHPPFVEAYEAEGVLINSGQFAGMQNEVAKKVIIRFIEEKRLGNAVVNYCATGVFHVKDTGARRYR